jgi:hypothetical protein
MVRKSKKAITGKRTIPGSGFGIPGPGLDLVKDHLTSAREIVREEKRVREEEGLE